MATQLKDKNGQNVYPVTENGGSGGGSESGGGFDYTAELAYSYEMCKVSGKYINSTGGETSNTYWKCTDYLPIVSDSIIVKYTKPVWYLNTNGFTGYFAFYDENKTFISGKSYKCETGMTDSGVTISFDEWATKPAYVRFSIAVANPQNATYVAAEHFYFRATQTVVGADAVDLQIENAKNGGIYKVMMFGNSFTDNTLACVQSILNGFGITNVLIQYSAISSASLGDYALKISSSNDVCEFQAFRTAAGGAMAYPLESMAEVLAHDWDFICFQQQSSSSGSYTQNDETDLSALIAAAKQYCTNPYVKIGWLMAWQTRMNGTVTPYSNIANAVKSMKAAHPEVVVIPVGTAVENARGTSVNSSGGYLCNDYTENEQNYNTGLFYQHLGSGAGQYTAACTFFETVLAPVVGKSIFRNNYSYTAASGSNAGIVSVNDANRCICQKAAWYACVNPYAVTPAEWLDAEYVNPTTNES